MGRIPLAELAEIGFPAKRGSIVVVRRDGKTFYVLSGEGLEAFAEQVGQAAPDAEVRVGDLPRRLSDWFH